MMLKTLVLAVVLGAAGLASAQTASPASASKKEQVAKLVLQLRPAVEGLATQLTQQPTVPIQQGAGMALQRLPAERREAVAHDIDADLRKYFEETVPLVRERAVKIAPTTIGTLIDERFTEDEIRQILAMLESPLNKKFQALLPEMQKALGEKLVAETKDEVTVKLHALETAVNGRLAPAFAAAASAPAKPAAAASRPAAKK